MTEQKNLLEEVRLIIRLIPYSVKWKLQLVATSFFLLASAINIIGPRIDGSVSPVSGMYTALAPLMLSQTLMILTYTGFVQSSPWRNDLQCRLYALLSFLLSCAAYTLMLLIAGILAAFGQFDSSLLISFILPLIATSLTLGWVYPVVYKIGMKLYLILMVIAIAFAVSATQMLFMNGRLDVVYESMRVFPVPVLVVLPYIVFMIQSGLMAFVAQAVYRRSVNQWYVNQAFKQAK